MVKTLGYKSALAGLIEDSVSRDENGVEVIEEDEEDGNEGGGGVVDGEKGRNVKRQGDDRDGVASGSPTVEDVAAASVMFKANAKRTKGRIVSSAPLGSLWTSGAVNAQTNMKVNTQSAPQTLKKGSSEASISSLSPSASASASNKQPIPPTHS